MSYVRWGSVVNSALSAEDQLELYGQGFDYKTIKQKKLQAPEAYCSDWYIFWYSGGEYDDFESKEKQHLAMWLAGEDNLATLDYLSVKYMYEHDDWTMLGYSDIPQKSLLVRCVRDWLENVEKECK